MLLFPSEFALFTLFVLVHGETKKSLVCEAGPAPIDASSLVQVLLHEKISRSPMRRFAAAKLDAGPVFSAQVSAEIATPSLALTKSTGMQAWLLLEQVGPAQPVNDDWPTGGDVSIRGPGFRIEYATILVCNSICAVFVFLWAWNQHVGASPKKASDSASANAGNPDTGAILSRSVANNDSFPENTNVQFRNKSELLDAFAALPLRWRHICIFMCAIAGFSGAGALNDTIGLTFGSFEQEWGAQTQSRLACLSLVSTTGQILASIFVGHIADLKGRCFVIRNGSLLVAAFCGLSAVAPSLQVLALARFLGGLGYGALNVAIPTLLSECMPSRARHFVVLYQFGWPAGAGIFTYIMARHSWRVAAVAFLPGASMVVAMFWCPGCLPESPKWLCSQDRLDEATESVIKFGYTPASSTDVDNALGSVQADGDQSGEATVAQSFYLRVMFSILCVASASMLIKVWLPQVLSQRGVKSSTMAFVTMWAVEASALVCAGFLFGAPARTRDSPDNLPLLHVSQVGFLASALAVLGYFKVTSSVPILLTGIAHLLGQSIANNFLMAYATLSFPVAVRARCVAGIFLASYAGCFVGPLFGAILLQCSSTKLIGAYSVLSVGCFVYACGYFGVHGLGSQDKHK